MLERAIGPAVKPAGIAADTSHSCTYPWRRRPQFFRDRLPNPKDYFENHGVKLLGGGIWKSALCPFHNDTSPSLRVFVETGAFRCMVCGARGHDVLAYHMQRHGLPFIDAAKALGA